jgi:hypothetical protein
MLEPKVTKFTPLSPIPLRYKVFVSSLYSTLNFRSIFAVRTNFHVHTYLWVDVQFLYIYICSSFNVMDHIVMCLSDYNAV